ncbi:MAG: type II secretion system F family protein, partial [Alphaproteobacteria bacterium]
RSVGIGRIFGAGGAGEGHRNRPLSIRFQDDQFKWMNHFKPIYERFVPSEDDLTTLRLKMINAGYRNPMAVSKFYGMRIVLGAGLFAGILLSGPVFFSQYPFEKILLVSVIGGLVGYFLPVAFIARQTATRKRLIREGFPDSLDMLLVCVEAGLGLDSAIAKVAAEIGKAHPILGEEMHLTGLELRAGKGRQEALHNLGQRTGVEDVCTMVTLLVQSDSLGTSIGQALRVHSFEMRAKRLLRAEEKAHKIPVKLSFPLIFGLLPVLMAVVLAPAIIRAVQFLGPVLQRGMPVPGG